MKEVDFVKIQEKYKKISFKKVIKNIFGFDLKSFKAKPNKMKLLNKSFSLAMKKFNKDKINTASVRKNEVGNKIEFFVLEALNKNGFIASIPSKKDEKKQSSGYPDIVFIDDKKELIYLECKTYSKNNTKDTFRSFYLSATKSGKITKNAPHLLIVFEIEKGKKYYSANSWKLLTLEDLNVKLKIEFNASNKDLYTRNRIISQG